MFGDEQKPNTLCRDRNKHSAREGHRGDKEREWVTERKAGPAPGCGRGGAQDTQRRRR